MTQEQAELPPYLAASLLQHLCVLHRLVNVWENTDFACDGNRELLVSQPNWERIEKTGEWLAQCYKKTPASTKPAISCGKAWPKPVACPPAAFLLACPLHGLRQG